MGTGWAINNNSRGRGGHEKWEKPGMDRPFTLQTHVDPVPLRIVKQFLRNTGISRKQYLDDLDINK